MRADRMRAIVHVQMVVAVQLQHIEAQHEALQNRVCLEGDDAVQIAFVLRPKDGTVDFAVELLEEVVFAQRLHVIWNKREEKYLVFI